MRFFSRYLFLACVVFPIFNGAQASAFGQQYQQLEKKINAALSCELTDTDEEFEDHYLLAVINIEWVASCCHAQLSKHVIHSLLSNSAYLIRAPPISL